MKLGAALLQINYNNVYYFAGLYRATCSLMISLGMFSQTPEDIVLRYCKPFAVSNYG